MSVVHSDKPKFWGFFPCNLLVNFSIILHRINCPNFAIYFCCRLANYTSFSSQKRQNHGIFLAKFFISSSWMIIKFCKIFLINWPILCFYLDTVGLKSCFYQCPTEKILKFSSYWQILYFSHNWVAKLSMKDNDSFCRTL